MTTMKALVYAGLGVKEVRDVPKPKILKDTDAIVRIVKTTIHSASDGVNRRAGD